VQLNIVDKKSFFSSEVLSFVGMGKYASIGRFIALDNARRQRNKLHWRFNALLYDSVTTDLLRSCLASESRAISDRHVAKAFAMQENVPLLCCCSKIGYFT
jgi:hypothetical protein